MKPLAGQKIGCMPPRKKLVIKGIGEVTFELVSVSNFSPPVDAASGRGSSMLRDNSMEQYQGCKADVVL